MFMLTHVVRYCHYYSLLLLVTFSTHTIVATLPFGVYSWSETIRFANCYYHYCYYYCYYYYCWGYYCYYCYYYGIATTTAISRDVQTNAGP